MKYIAVIGPYKCFHYWAADFVWKDKEGRNWFEVGGVRFVSVCQGEELMGMHLAGYVAIGPPSEWNAELRRALEIARTRVRP